MKIEKYKKNRNGKYSIFLSDGREFVLYEEVILKCNLLLKKEINNTDIDNINKLNNEYEVYYAGLKLISNRSRSVYELKKKLREKEYSYELIENTVEKLLKQGYLNDELYARSYINTQIFTTTNGPIKIRRDLENNRIDSSIIDKEIELFDIDTQKEKVDKLISKWIKSNHNKGGLVLKQKIINNLKNKGYSYDIIITVIDNYTFSNDTKLAKKEYDKLYRKYSKKYSGYELDKIIKERLYLKGLIYEKE